MTSAAACRAVRYLLHIFKFFFNIGKTVFPIKCVFYIKQLYLFAITDHYLELSSQMQRYIKINFKRRFPVQAFAWTLI